MIHVVFSIHDQKADAFLPPFILPRTEMAVRTFSDCVASEDHQFGAHPEDYTLFRLGTFDDSNGLYVVEPIPIVVRTGLECRASINAARDKTNGQVSNETPVLSSPAGDDPAELL